MMKNRLSLMMFLEYVAPGIFMPMISLYLKNYLHFTPLQVGQIMAMTAVAAIVAPFVVAYVADRLISSERLLSVCHIASGVVIVLLYFQDEYWPFLFLYLVYGLLFMPTFALTNAVTFHHVEDVKRDFGAIRMWGPASWVVVAWGFSVIWLRGHPTGEINPRLPHAFLVAAGASFVLGAYALTLPASARKSDKPGLAFLKVMGMFARPSLAVLCVASLLNAMVHQFYYYGMGPYLKQIGYPEKYILPAMSMGQFGEMVMLFLLGRFLVRMTMKQAMVIGILAQVLRYLVFATGEPIVTALVIPLHGVCYAFFFAVAYIYVDSHSAPEDRAGAQQLFNILIAGLGNLAGSLTAGKLGDTFFDASANHIDFQSFWIVSAAAALALGLFMAVAFRDRAANPAPRT